MPGLLIRRLHQIHVSVFADAMRDVGLDLTPPQFGALSVIAERPGLDQATLAGLIAVDRPTVGGVVDRLVAKGLVTRDTRASDRRAKVLGLTEQGHSILGQCLPVIDAVQSTILSGLSESEQAEFMRLATKIAKAGNDKSRAPLVVPPDQMDETP